MRTLIRVAVTMICGGFVFLPAACGSDSDVSGTKQRELDVGIHRVRLSIPREWNHANHGREQLFDRGMAQISLADLGPMTPDGFAKQLRRAHELFKKNQWDDARTLLQGTDPRRFFASERHWNAIRNDWRKITRIKRRDGSNEGRGVSAETEWEVEAAFAHLLTEVATLPLLNLETLAMRALAELGHDEMRSVAETQSMAISGRPAVRIETWDRLSHRGRLKHVFIENAGHLLCLRTEFGNQAGLNEGFEAMLASLEFVPNQDSSGDWADAGAARDDDVDG